MKTGNELPRGTGPPPRHSSYLAQPRYEWDYLYGALEVVEGGSCFAFIATVGLELTSFFLEQIAATDPQAEHVVLYDQAGFHPRQPEKKWKTNERTDLPF